MDKVDTELKRQTFDGWLRGAAQMVVATSSMRLLGVIDEGESADILDRLSVLIVQGTEALGYNDVGKDLPEFVKDLTALHDKSVDSGRDMIADLKVKVAQIEGGD